MNGVVMMDHPKFDSTMLAEIEKSLAGESDLEYWLSKTPQERLAALEYMRQIVYGYDPATSKIKRVIEIVDHEGRVISRSKPPDKQP